MDGIGSVIDYYVRTDVIDYYGDIRGSVRDDPTSDASEMMS